ncbi:alpha/beta hydrolase [Roseibium salinum]|uniref:Alpha/beta hydrolase-fold protein n=1 Tax=Roseibium salinum TaxID=1604349 RepID=A0ABT3QWW7_9HYPH|nr:alpha/beta hydrolase-fold protein [Roseibium sp. DSM 29163]MCX2721422.1 alpha/beta hydrolase-fold protein [Roseibium sp. DSM 29163]
MTRMKLSSCAIPGTAAYDLVSARNGQTYRVFVHIPAGEPPAEGWPVLYLTDGNAVIGTAVEAMRAQAGYPTGTNVAPGVIVAIGYPTDDPYDPLRRSWDLSPLPGKTYPPFFADGPDVKTGGGEEFLGFIEADVKPFVHSLARIDPARQSLFGHSFGGLFALFAFFTRPHAFRNWIAASPAIFWDDGLILQYRDRFLAALPQRLDTFLHFSAGEYEGDDLAPFQRQAEDAGSRLEEKKKTRTIGHARELSAELAALEEVSIRTHYETFAYETHMSVLPAAVGRAVQIAFAVRPLGYLCET